MLGGSRRSLADLLCVWKKTRKFEEQTHSGRVSPRSPKFPWKLLIEGSWVKHLNFEDHELHNMNFYTINGRQRERADLPLGLPTWKLEEMATQTQHYSLHARVIRRLANGLLALRGGPLLAEQIADSELTIPNWPIPGLQWTFSNKHSPMEILH